MSKTRSRLRIFVAGFALGALSMLWLVARDPSRRPATETVHADSRTVSQRSQEDLSFAEPAAFPRKLAIPVQGVSRTAILDTFNESRGTEHRHEATDILAPRGAPVIAADDGVIKKLFLSKPGGITLYEFDPTEQYCYYYAHLDSYADGIREGVMLKRGDVIGYVGTTGNAPADAPHLHFAIFRLGPEKRWWEGTPIDPYPILTTTKQF